MCFFKQI